MVILQYCCKCILFTVIQELEPTIREIGEIGHIGRQKTPSLPIDSDDVPDVPDVPDVVSSPSSVMSNNSSNEQVHVQSANIHNDNHNDNNDCNDDDNVEMNIPIRRPLTKKRSTLDEIMMTDIFLIMMKEIKSIDKIAIICKKYFYNLLMYYTYRIICNVYV